MFWPFLVKWIPSGTLFQHFQWNKFATVPYCCISQWNNYTVLPYYCIFDEKKSSTAPYFSPFDGRNPKLCFILAFSIWKNPQPYLIFSLQWKRSIAVLYFSILNGINPQLYLISTFSIKQIHSHTFFFIFNRINPQSCLILAFLMD